MGWASLPPKSMTTMSGRNLRAWSWRRLGQSKKSGRVSPDETLKSRAGETRPVAPASRSSDSPKPWACESPAM
jgi:hypothetical protein